jgi:methyltransferase family protein
MNATAATCSRQAVPCGDKHPAKGREPLQMGWYEYAASLVTGKSVLDVGWGSVEIHDIAAVPDRAFDVVVCIDVIEHVQDDVSFVQHLVHVGLKRWLRVRIWPHQAVVLRMAR